MSFDILSGDIMQTFVECAVSGCGNNSENSKCNGVKFFHFPTDIYYAREWVRLCGRQKLLHLQTARMCSNHFDSSQIKQNSKGHKGPLSSKTLIAGAMPSLNVPQNVPASKLQPPPPRTRRRKTPPLIAHVDQDLFQMNNPYIVVSSQSRLLSHESSTPTRSKTKMAQSVQPYLPAEFSNKSIQLATKVGFKGATKDEVHNRNAKRVTKNNPKHVEPDSSEPEYMSISYEVPYEALIPEIEMKDSSPERVKPTPVKKKKKNKYPFTTKPRRIKPKKTPKKDVVSNTSMSQNTTDSQKENEPDDHKPVIEDLKIVQKKESKDLKKMSNADNKTTIESNLKSTDPRVDIDKKTPIRRDKNENSDTKQRDHSKSSKNDAKSLQADPNSKIKEGSLENKIKSKRPHEDTEDDSENPRKIRKSLRTRPTHTTPAKPSDSKSESLLKEKEKDIVKDIDKSADNKLTDENPKNTTNDAKKKNVSRTKSKSVVKLEKVSNDIEEGECSENIYNSNVTEDGKVLDDAAKSSIKLPEGTAESSVKEVGEVVDDTSKLTGSKVSKDTAKSLTVKEEGEVTDDSSKLTTKAGSKVSEYTAKSSTVKEVGEVTEDTSKLTDKAANKVSKDAAKSSTSKVSKDTSKSSTIKEVGEVSEESDDDHKETNNVDDDESFKASEDASSDVSVEPEKKKPKPKKRSFSQYNSKIIFKNGQQMKKRQPNQPRVNKSFCKTYSSSKPLQRHSCEKCDVSFVNSIYLKRHVKKCKRRLMLNFDMEELLHTKDEQGKFMCILCSEKKSFNISYNLKKHIIRHKLRDLQSDRESINKIFRDRYMEDKDWMECPVSVIFRPDRKNDTLPPGRRELEEIENQILILELPDERKFEDFSVKSLNLESLYDVLLTLNSKSVDSSDEESKPVLLYVKEYSCKTCHKKYLLKEDLEYHVQSVHEDEGFEFVCNYCTMVFCHIISLKRHVSRRHKVRLNREENRYLADNPFSMMIADFNVYICKTCPKIFETKDSLMDHIEMHEVQNDVFFKTLNFEHRTSGHTYPCNDCDSSFLTYEELKSHMAFHQSQRQFICDICSKCYHSKVDLITHIQAHDKARPFMCKDCGKTFITLNVLRVHEKRYHRVKSLNCPICGKWFGVYHDLKTHMQCHIGDKSWCCEICGNRFTSKQALISHVNNHMDLYFTCNICSEDFPTKFKLQQHLKMHATEVTYDNSYDMIIVG